MLELYLRRYSKKNNITSKKSPLRFYKFQIFIRFLSAAFRESTKILRWEAQRDHKGGRVSLCDVP